MTILPPARLEAGEELHRCPNCGYEDGFHSTFRRRPDGRYDVIFVCPNCSRRYDLGLVVELGRFGD